MMLSARVHEVLEDLCRTPDRPTPESVLAPVASVVEKYLGSARFDQTFYMRHPIYLGEDWEVMVIAWDAGQRTPIHDHRGVMGSMLVYSGTLMEERFETPEGCPKLLESSRRPAGDACTTSPTLLHRLFPANGKTLSLHIYRPPLRQMGIWEAQGLTQIVPSQYDVPADALLGRE
jgi:cysteine dioxygenase